MSHAGYVLGLADDALITAQRLGEWCSRAPEMEEDIALANIALDQLGVARMLLTYAGELEGRGRTEDDLAYLRSEAEFRNVRLVELDNGDFAVTMAKLLFLSVYQRLLYDWSIGVGDERLAAVAAKARKESAYHVDHSSRWVVRLGAPAHAGRGRPGLAVHAPAVRAGPGRAGAGRGRRRGRPLDAAPGVAGGDRRGPHRGDADAARGR
jgi:ring-1,2-phenylacetyl-CoA epoxidase subunit PaaC